MKKKFHHIAYGRKRCRTEHKGLLLMDEICLCASPKNLRLIAAFINQAADTLAGGAPKGCGLHLSSFIEFNDDTITDIVVTDEE